MTDPIQTIREALQQNWSMGRDGVKHYQHAEALAALDEIEGNVLPELPQTHPKMIAMKWNFEQSQYHIIIGKRQFEGWINGNGPTPRAAVLAAIAKIGGTE